MISCFFGRFKITSPRAWRSWGSVKEFHKGLDIVAIDDKTVRAIADGKVRTLSEPNGFGNYVRQYLDDGRRIYYGHMSSFTVSDNTYVHAGDKIGVMGSTGKSTGAHTHLELRPKGTSKTSLDICEFTGIPNKTGTYTYKEETNMANRFTDIGGSIAEKDIEELCDMGIVQGDGNAKFRPKDAISREEAALLVRRAVKYITGK